MTKSKYKELEIDVQEIQTEEDRSILPVPLSSLRALNSMKNLHDSKKNQGQIMPGNLAMDLRIKLMSMRKLEKQKKELIRSYETLRKGAIEALVDKEDMIDSLREKCQNYQQHGGEQQLKELEFQLKKHLEHILQLEEQREELKSKIQNQRALFIEDIQNKSQMIATLWKELQAVQQELERMEVKQATIELKLRMTEEQNQKLLISLKAIEQNLTNLQNSQHSEFSKREFDTYRNLRPLSQESLQEDQFDQYDISLAIEKTKFLLSPTSSASTKPNAFDQHLFRSRNNDHEYEQGGFLRQQLYNEKQRHQRQIRSLQKIYAEKLQALKFNLCKSQLEVQYQKSKRDEQEFDVNRIVRDQIYSDDSQSSIIQEAHKGEEPTKQPVNIRKLIENCDSTANLFMDTGEYDIEHHPTIFLNEKVQIPQLPVQIENIQANNNQMEVHQQQQNNKWTKRMCFVLGVITGGSLVAIVSKIILTNN